MQRPDEVIRAVLRSVRQRWFWAEWAVVLAWIAAALAAAAVGFAVLAWWAQPALEWRVAVVGALTAMVLAFASWKAWPVRRRPSDVQVARFVEERVADLHESLTSAVGAHGAERSAFHDLVVQEAARHAEAIDLDAVIERGVLVRRAVLLAGAVAGAVAVCWPVVPALERTVLEARARWFPATLSLQVSPGDTEVVEGEPLTVSAAVTGVPSGLIAGEAFVEVSGEPPRLVAMEPAAKSLRAELSHVAADLTYAVRVGALRSPEYRVTVRRRPAVSRIDVRYDYPSYTRLAQRVDEDSGDIYAPAGTKVEVRVTTRDPVASGGLAFADGAPLGLDAIAPRQLRGEFTVATDTAYRVALDDGRGLRARDDTEYFVRVMDDRPPDVRLVRPGTDGKVTRLEEVTIEARADDDHGVDKLEIVYAARGGPERAVALHAGRPAQTVTGTHVLPVETLDVQPGDFVTVYARARDVSRGKRASEVRSDIVFLEVRPFVEEFELAASQAMAGMGGGAMDDLVGLQKQVVVAAWRLDRRSGAGRSAEDIRAVARAQAEVRARALQLAQRMTPQPAPRRGRSGRPGQPGLQTPPGQPVAVPPQAEAMQRAVGAMERAQTELEALRTAQAIPHAMAALNDLLRAQADQQRRQVSQQRSAGGRGGSSGNQDLSALFDRELQRQQQTSYETPATAERREETRESDAMARLRELARRQEELARRQRELARQQARQSPEERKRELERLTREQEELQQRAEALNRDLSRETTGESRQQAGGQAQRGDPRGQQRGDQRGDSSRPGQGGSSPSDGRETVQRALEEMRQAAGELRRDNAGEAGTRAERAAEALEAAERRLRAEREAAERGREGGQSREGQRDERLADRLARTQALRDRIASLSRRLDQLQREAASEREGAEPRVGSDRRSAAEEARRAEAEPRERGRPSQPGSPGPEGGPASEPRRGETRGEASREGAGQGRGGDRGREMERVQGELQRALRESSEMLDQMGRDESGRGSAATTPEGRSPTPSAPGTEAFKQDYARWESLKKDIELALERTELSLSRQLAQETARNRLDRGADDRVPDAWRARVADYFRSLARRER